MLIASFKPGHDGTIAAIDNGRLVASFEAEKDSFPRYDRLGPTHFLEFLAALDRAPDVVCVSGWPKGFHSAERPLGHGYFGVGRGSHGFSDTKIFGSPAKLFSSTHERSHIFCAVGMSPFADFSVCNCLVWEGNIGRFYRVSRTGEIKAYPTAMVDPGNKYAFLYSVADNSSTPPSGRGVLRLEDAGKLMALCAYGDPGTPTADEAEVIDWLLGIEDGVILNHGKDELSHTRYFNAGVIDPAFCGLARRFSDAVFDRFHRFAEQHLDPGLPLVIAGGCGLNCDWNKKWRESPLFTDVFVPPCANDSGSAIGTAIEARAHGDRLVGLRRTSVRDGRRSEGVGRFHATLRCHPSRGGPRRGPRCGLGPWTLRDRTPGIGQPVDPGGSFPRCNARSAQSHQEA
jgi:hydroxymethyl cephem carbamoyltransferase